MDGNRLYLQLIHSGGAGVVALDKKTGSEIWKQHRISDARDECEQSYASPVIYRDGKTELLLTHGADCIVAHRLTDGKEIWRCGGLNPKGHYNNTLRFVASPVAVPGLIVVPSAKNGPVLGLRPDGKGDVTTNAAAHLWTRAQNTPDVPSPLVYDGLVYLCRENGNLIVMDAHSGEQIYRASHAPGSPPRQPGLCRRQIVSGRSRRHGDGRQSRPELRGIGLHPDDRKYLRLAGRRQWHALSAHVRCAVCDSGQGVRRISDL